MDAGKLNMLGWKPKINLREGIIKTLEEIKITFE
jgi:nucleoside-diphosphate-sugar epimerase